MSRLVNQKTLLQINSDGLALYGSAIRSRLTVDEFARVSNLVDNLLAGVVVSRLPTNPIPLDGSDKEDPKTELVKGSVYIQKSYVELMEIIYELGKAYLRAMDWEKALYLLSTLRRISPEDTDVCSLIRQGKLEWAKDLISKNRVKEGLEKLRELMVQSPEDQEVRSLYLDFSRKYIQKLAVKDWNIAKCELDNLISLFPNLPTLLKDQQELNLQQERWKLLNSGPEQIENLVLWVTRNRWDNEALQYLCELLYHNASDALKLERWMDAREGFNRIINMIPNFRDAQNKRREVYVKWLERLINSRNLRSVHNILESFIKDSSNDAFQVLTTVSWPIDPVYRWNIKYVGESSEELNWWQALLTTSYVRVLYIDPIDHGYSQDIGCYMRYQPGVEGVLVILPRGYPTIIIGDQEKIGLFIHNP